MSADPAPATLLSVVVVPYAGIDAMRRTLDALARQEHAGAVEILVPVDDETAAWLAVGTHPARPRIVRIPGRRGPAARRAAGVAASGGSIVAITEDHCMPEPGWVAAMRRAHEEGPAAIGGPVDKAEPDGAVGWALYLADYGRYMSPVAEGPADALTDCNVSYKKAALDAIAPVWTDVFHETVVHRALRERGDTLWLSAAPRVRQARTRPLGALLYERYAHGRLYASARVAGAPAGRRAGLALAAPALPAVIAQRSVAAAFRARRGARGLLALPAILASGTAWALGELLGYATGRGPERLP